MILARSGLRRVRSFGPHWVAALGRRAPSGGKALQPSAYGVVLTAPLRGSGKRVFPPSLCFAALRSAKNLRNASGLSPSLSTRLFRFMSFFFNPSFACEGVKKKTALVVEAIFFSKKALTSSGRWRSTGENGSFT